MVNTQPLLKRILLPCWLLRFGLNLALIGIYSWALAYVRDLSDDDFDVPAGTRISDAQMQNTRREAIGVIAPLLALLVLCALLDITNFAIISQRRLRAMVSTINVLQTLFWLAMLILSAVGTPAAHNAGVVVNVIMFLLYLGPIVYAGLAYRHDRKEDASGYQQAPRSDSYEARSRDLQGQLYGHRQSYSNGGNMLRYSDLPESRQVHDRGNALQSSGESYLDF